MSRVKHTRIRRRGIFIMAVHDLLITAIMLLGNGRTHW